MTIGLASFTGFCLWIAGAASWSFWHQPQVPIVQCPSAEVDRNLEVTCVCRCSNDTVSEAAPAVGVSRAALAGLTWSTLAVLEGLQLAVGGCAFLWYGGFCGRRGQPDRIQGERPRRLAGGTNAYGRSGGLVVHRRDGQPRALADDAHLSATSGADLR
jgi:hypothetical protein